MIGIHRGPAVAVIADGRLDFFGRETTVAPRVLDLAVAGEILLTDEAIRDGAVAAFLRNSGFSAVAREATLRGEGNTIRVHSCKR